LAEQLIKKNLPFIKILPSWAQDLSYKYLSKTTNLYLIHGNIRDFLPHKMNEGEFTFTKVQEYIAEVLFGNRDIIAYFDRSSGVTFNRRQMKDEYMMTMKDMYPQEDPGKFLSLDPMEAFHYLERYVVKNLPAKKRMVIIIDYAETLLPNSDVARLSEEDRYTMVTLNRWAHDPIFTQGDVSILLLTENLADLSPKIVASPSTVKVPIPIPDTNVRTQFLQFLERNDKLILENRLTAEAMGKITSGLNLLNLNQIAAESYQEDVPISMDYLKTKKKEIIENEAGGLLEFIESEFDLGMVSGHDFVKKRFKSAARAIKQGRLDVLPMGYLVAGPVGTGKSFMVTAFTGEIGIPMVMFKNFRSKWQGVTESNLEKVLSILKAMSPVGVMIDEADAFPGGPQPGRGQRDQQSDLRSDRQLYGEHRVPGQDHLVPDHLPTGSDSHRPEAPGSGRRAPGPLLPRVCTGKSGALRNPGPQTQAQDPEIPCCGCPEEVQARILRGRPGVSPDPHQVCRHHGQPDHHHPGRP
jgi:hypothetical protein